MHVCHRVNVDPLSFYLLPLLQKWGYTGYQQASLWAYTGLEAENAILGHLQEYAGIYGWLIQSVTQF